MTSALPVKRRVLFLGALGVVTNRSALEWFPHRCGRESAKSFPTAIFDHGRQPPGVPRALIAEPPARTARRRSMSGRTWIGRASPRTRRDGLRANIKLRQYLQAGVPSSALRWRREASICDEEDFRGR